MADESQHVSLEDMLSDKELPETEAEQAEEEGGAGEETETEGKEGDKPEGTDETETDDDSTPESDASKDKPKDDEGESWTKAAVLDERRKRQELQAELERLKQEREPDRAEEAPDWYAEPERAAEAQRQQFEQMLFTQKVELSQDMMRSQHADYDEMEQKFFDLCQENPALRTELRLSANPARFAYETAKKASEYEAMKDVESYKAKLKAEVRSELEEQIRKEQEAAQARLEKKRAAADPSLASASSKGGLSSSDYSGPTPLDEILK